MGHAGTHQEVGGGRPLKVHMNFSIPLRLKLYALIAVAFAMGVLGLRAKWIGDGEARVRDKLEKQRAKAIEDATEVRNEVEALDRDTLRDRATRWVRDGKR